MASINSKFFLFLMGTLLLAGCKDEDGNLSVGVSLGGTGTGGLSVGTESPVPKP